MNKRFALFRVVGTGFPLEHGDDKEKKIETI